MGWGGVGGGVDLPDDGEERGLDAVGEQARAQAAGEEADDALLLDDLLGRLRVGDGDLRRLRGG